MPAPRHDNRNPRRKMATATPRVALCSRGSSHHPSRPLATDRSPDDQAHIAWRPASEPSRGSTVRDPLPTRLAVGRLRAGLRLLVARVPFRFGDPRAGQSGACRCVAAGDQEGRRCRSCNPPPRRHRPSGSRGEPRRGWRRKVWLGRNVSRPSAVEIARRGAVVMATQVLALSGCATRTHSDRDPLVGVGGT